jgi:hypothetical protein
VVTPGTAFKKLKPNPLEANVSDSWIPAALLPNIFSEKPIDGEHLAIVRRDDVRLNAICAAHPQVNEFIHQFTDTFGVPIEPMILLVREDCKHVSVDAIASFRDLLALSVVPYSRALGTVYGNHAADRISYSNSFLLYPWTFSADYQHIVANTPGFKGVHLTSEFHGQSSPEIPPLELDAIDMPLLRSLLRRWERHYLGKRARWHDRVLFRSLNMAYQAAQMPAPGIDVTIYDLGRLIALWVSAFEILAHTRTGGSGVKQVFSLLNQVAYRQSALGHRKFSAFVSRNRKIRASLPCWIYGGLYRARCDFLHGNPIRKDRLSFTGARVSLFWIAPSLYRLALAGFLKLPHESLSTGGIHADPQSIIERAILRARRTR